MPRMLLELVATMLPLATERNPERQHDQANVEFEALVAYVYEVVSELVAARDIAGRKNLRNSGQPWAHPVALLVAGDVGDCDMRAVGVDLDLAGAQRPRPDKCHVAAEDVPQLGQFIERGGAQYLADPGNSWVVFARLQR